MEQAHSPAVGAMGGPRIEGGANSRGGRVSSAYNTLLAVYVVLTIGWLALGAVAAVVEYSPSIRAALGGASGQWIGSWAQGLLVGAGRSEPLGQVVLDYGLSGLNLVVAGVLWRSGQGDWATRLLTVALVGSAGAVNLQAHTSIETIETGFEMSIGWWHVLLLHGVGGVAYVLALLLYPTGQWERSGPTSWLTQVAVGVTVAGVLSLLALSTAEYPHTVTFVVFFGILVPLLGLGAQWHRARHGAVPEMRRRSRLLFAALSVALGIAGVLGAVSVVLWALHVPGVTLFDPTAHAPGRPLHEPLSVVFWPVRLIFAAIPLTLIVTNRRARSWEAERLFNLALAYAILVVLLSSGFLVLVACVSALLGLPLASPLPIAAAAVAVALLFSPARTGTERLVDRLIYGRRPAASVVLAKVADVSSTTDVLDLAELAEVLARGLQATFCRLTLRVSGLDDRTYQWPPDLADLAEPVTVPVLYGDEQVGEMTVDRTSVTDVSGRRGRLLHDLVGILGPVLYNSRLNVELEHQLQTALQRAEEIGASRRRITADMDSERRALERNLHDGAQHHLVALRMTLGLVEHEIKHGRPNAARNRIDQVAAQVDGTRRVLASTAAGVFPVVLADHGLLPALSSELGNSEPSVVLDLDEAALDRRFPLAVETAVYFTCLEAINNAFKHAPQATVKVTIRSEYRGLAFSITDDGPGFTPDPDQGSGHGLHNIATRANAVGGTLTVRSTPEVGTAVEGFIPL